MKSVGPQKMPRNTGFHLLNVAKAAIHPIDIGGLYISVAPNDPRAVQLNSKRRSDPSEPYREVSVDRNTATRTQTLKYGREGRKAGREPKENYQTPQKPTETPGPCPDLRGTCIKALTVHPNG